MKHEIRALQRLPILHRQYSCDLAVYRRDDPRVPVCTYSRRGDYRLDLRRAVLVSAAVGGALLLSALLRAAGRRGEKRKP